MKDYPSIPQSTGSKFFEIPDALIFDKLDGSSLRAEWSKNKGWFKFGRRNGLLDDSNPQLKASLKLFEVTMAEPLEKIIFDQRWSHLIVFYEFWGRQSLGGLHVDEDPKSLTLFDADADKRGIIDPRTFRCIFEDRVATPRFLGRHNFTRGFAAHVRDNDVPGITFEGVVAKAGYGHDIVRAKAKTQQWIDAIKAMHGDKADSIINS